MSDIKKMAVLAVLKRGGEALSLPEICRVLGAEYSERSVRRWLGELVDNELVDKTGQKRGTKYQIIRPLQASELGSLFSEKSKKALENVSRPLFEREPVTYNIDWLESYIPNKSFYLSSSHRDALLLAGARDHDKEPAGTYAHHIYNRLLIDLSYNSSRLEGNTYSLLDTERLLIEGTSAKDKLDEEKVMILNHKEAIRYLVDNAGKLAVNTETVRTIHYLLSEGLVPRAFSGIPRDHGVRVGGSTYIPFEDQKTLEKLLKQVCEKCEKIQNAYEQSLFLLIHLAYLQAFSDVNKRTARLCANIPLIQKNLVPLSFNEVNKEEYISAMIAVYELNEVSPLLEIYYNSYLRTCKQYNVTVEAVSFDEVRVRYRQERRKMIRNIIENKRIGKDLENYIKSEIEAQIPPSDRQDFRGDLEEDLALLTPQSIVGLRISQEQLYEWQKISKDLK